MMCPSAEPQDAGIGRGRLPGAGMEQHLAGLARPADGLPVDLVEMAHLAGQMIAPRRLARGVECRIGGRGVVNMLAHGLLSSSSFLKLRQGSSARLRHPARRQPAWRRAARSIPIAAAPSNGRAEVPGRRQDRLTPAARFRNEGSTNSPARAYECQAGASVLCRLESFCVWVGGAIGSKPELPAGRLAIAEMSRATCRSGFKPSTLGAADADGSSVMNAFPLRFVIANCPVVKSPTIFSCASTRCLSNKVSTPFE